MRACQMHGVLTHSLHQEVLLQLPPAMSSIWNFVAACAAAGTIGAISGKEL